MEVCSGVRWCVEACSVDSENDISLNEEIKWRMVLLASTVKDTK